MWIFRHCMTRCRTRIIGLCYYHSNDNFDAVWSHPASFSSVILHKICRSNTLYMIYSYYLFQKYSLIIRFVQLSLSIRNYSVLTIYKNVWTTAELRYIVGCGEPIASFIQWNKINITDLCLWKGTTEITRCLQKASQKIYIHVLFKDAARNIFVKGITIFINTKAILI